MKLRLHSLLPLSRVNGPGARFVVWVQGCSRRCPGCFNPDAWPLDGGEWMDVPRLARRIVSEPGIEGLTLSGGEPFEQPAACAALAQAVRRAGLSVFVFTGFTLEEIRRSADPHALALLREVDILVDGPFRREVRCRRLWRGSANQRVHFLSERYRPDQFPLDAAEAEVEVIIDETGDLRLTGFPDEPLSQRLGRA